MFKLFQEYMLKLNLGSRDYFSVRKMVDSLKMCTKSCIVDEVSPRDWMKCGSHMYVMGSIYTLPQS